MNLKRKICLFIMFLGLCCIGSSFVVLYLTNEEDSDSGVIQPEENKKDVVLRVVNDVFLSTDTSYAKITSYMGDKLLNENYVVLGSDSYLRKYPNSSEDLSLYRNKQDEYASKVEQIYLNNTKFDVKEDTEGLYFTITPWLFAAYSTDMSVLINKLLELEGIDPTLIETNYNEYLVYEYKAKVKAMIILDSYLSNYNNEEVFNFTFYLNDSSVVSNQYFSLYLNLVGSVSQKVIADSNRDSRINQYLQDAISSGVIDSTNPLDL